MGGKDTISGTYQGRRHRQKWFRSGKRVPSRTRRASFFVGRTPKRTKRTLLWKERVRRHWPKTGAISAQRGAISVPKSVVTAR